jgi:hypothetical protein
MMERCPHGCRCSGCGREFAQVPLVRWRAGAWSVTLCLVCDRKLRAHGQVSAWADRFRFFDRGPAFDVATLLGLLCAPARVEQEVLPW